MRFFCYGGTTQWYSSINLKSINPRTFCCLFGVEMTGPGKWPKTVPHGAAVPWLLFFCSGAVAPDRGSVDSQSHQYRILLSLESAITYDCVAIERGLLS